MRDLIKITVVVVSLLALHVILYVFFFTKFYNQDESYIILNILQYIIVGIVLLSDFKSFDKYNITFLILVVGFISFVQYLLFGIYTETSILLNIVLLVLNIAGIGYFLTVMRKKVASKVYDLVDVQPKYYLALFIVLLVNGLYLFL